MPKSEKTLAARELELLDTTRGKDAYRQARKTGTSLRTLVADRCTYLTKMADDIRTKLEAAEEASCSYQDQQNEDVFTGKLTLAEAAGQVVVLHRVLILRKEARRVFHARISARSKARSWVDRSSRKIQAKQ